MRRSCFGVAPFTEGMTRPEGATVDMISFLLRKIIARLALSKENLGIAPKKSNAQEVKNEVPDVSWQPETIQKRGSGRSVVMSAKRTHRELSSGQSQLRLKLKKAISVRLGVRPGHETSHVRLEGGYLAYV